MLTTDFDDIRLETDQVIRKGKNPAYLINIRNHLEVIRQTESTLQIERVLLKLNSMLYVPYTTDISELTPVLDSLENVL